MTNSKLIDKFIEIGKKEDFSMLETLFASEGVAMQSHIMRESPEFWHKVADSLADKEIVALIMIFTSVEMKLEGWSAGSVSPVIWLGQKLFKRNEALMDKTAKWVVFHTDNPWLPFGSLGTKTVEDYKQKPFKDFMRQCENLKKEEMIKSEAEERKRMRAEKHRFSLERQRKLSENRMKLLHELEKMTPGDRLNVIAKDKDHPIEYYPLEYAEVGSDIAKAANPLIRREWLDKIGHRRKGAWKKLADLLGISIEPGGRPST